jgi:hypothetical protein
MHASMNIKKKIHNIAVANWKICENTIMKSFRADSHVELFLSAENLELMGKLSASETLFNLTNLMRLEFRKCFIQFYLRQS